MPPNEGQCQGPDRADSKNDKRGPELPGDLFFGTPGAASGILELAAVLALYRFILNIFSAKGTLFHRHYSGLHPCSSLTGSGKTADRVYLTLTILFSPVILARIVVVGGMSLEAASGALIPSKNVALYKS
jgi:hypothetical protein